jgi:uracil DNA glycosylase
MTMTDEIQCYPYISTLGYIDEDSYVCNHTVYRPIDISRKVAPEWIDFFRKQEYAINEMLRYLYVTAYQSGVLSVKPLPEDVMNVFGMRPQDIKLVIVGQDPYPGNYRVPYKEGKKDKYKSLPVANGYAFATNSKDITSSLETVFGAIRGVEHATGDFTLKGWIDQCVFLLNKTPVLWVYETDTPVKDEKLLNTPERLWGDITKNICLFINSLHNGKESVPFLLFGTKASTLKSCLPTSIVASHPSGRNTSINNPFTDEPFTLTSSIIKWRKA